MAREYIVGYIFVACAAALLIGFTITAILARRGPDEYEPIHDKGYLVSRYWFIGLMAIAVVTLGATLPFMPYPLTSAPGDSASVTVVQVTARQWEWKIEPAELKVNQHIKFEVTSIDVNHDFAIYDSDGNILAQVQAMPTVTNDLYYTFHKPGTYTIRCLELCGLYHTSMLSSIKVTE